jgi:hypothetical protein
VPRGNIAAGLYPRPADIRVSARWYTPAELFWIVKNGIEMSGMPAWSDHSDAELRATVAFIKYCRQCRKPIIETSSWPALAQGGGHHHHGEGGEAASDTTRP